MIPIKKTLCKECSNCRTYWYERKTRIGYVVRFKYCGGNKEIVQKYNYGVTHPKVKSFVNIINSKRDGCYAKEKGKSITYYFKKNKKNYITYINKDRFDLRLKNLRELTRSCLLQQKEGKTSIFPGVTSKNNKYYSKIKIKGKSEYLGSYDEEMDAYHAYVLKHEELGIPINEETNAHNKYLKEHDPSKFTKWEKKQKTSQYKGVSKTKHNRYVVVGSIKGSEQEYIGEFKKEVDAFHAYVLWCKKNNKEVYIEHEEYQQFLAEKTPSFDLELFIKDRSMKKKKSTSKYPNVFYYSPTKRWMGRLRKKNKVLYQQYFTNEYDAHLAVEKKRKEFEENNKL